MLYETVCLRNAAIWYKLIKNVENESLHKSYFLFILGEFIGFVESTNTA